MRNKTHTADVSVVNAAWGALEAGLIMRTDWEVIRQAANDRTLRVWTLVTMVLPR